MATPEDVLNVARGELGYSRWNDPQNGTKYGRWYAGVTGDSYYGTSGVPYCAMFTSWVFAQAGQAAPGLPGAYCPWIVTAGRNSGMTVSARDARAGDIVLFDWGGDGVSDHVGIVEGNTGSHLTTIEGNTSGGKVARRTREYSTVICVIRPAYGNHVITATMGEIMSMDCIIQPNDAGRLDLLLGGQIHAAANPDEIESAQMVAQVANGGRLPVIKLGDRNAPWGSRFYDLLERGMVRDDVPRLV